MDSAVCVGVPRGECAISADGSGIVAGLSADCGEFPAEVHGVPRDCDCVDSAAYGGVPGGVKSAGCAVNSCGIVAGLSANGGEFPADVHGVTRDCDCFDSAICVGVPIGERAVSADGCGSVTGLTTGGGY